jgi:uncharacterized membrane protein
MSGAQTVQEATGMERGEPTSPPVSPPLPPRTPPSAELTSAVPPEQLLYAKILASGMYTGLCILLLTFAIYLSGVVQPAIPIDRLPEFWTMDVAHYLEAVNTRYLHHEHLLTGWAWLSVLEHSDYLNFVGIVVLSTVTLVCFLGIIPALLRKRDYAYAAIAVVEVVILTLAASGVLTAGGH